MAQLKRSLSLLDTTLLVIGGIIGTGIFFNTSNVAHHVNTSGLILSVWLIGGFVAIIGALSFAELGAMMPAVGGQYAFLREGLHPIVGFLYGWTLLLVIASGSTAAISTKFAEIIAGLTQSPFLATPLGTKGLALFTLWSLAVVNYFGIKAGAVVQNVFTAGKLGALAILIVAGFLAPAAALPISAVAGPDNLLTAIGA